MVFSFEDLALSFYLEQNAIAGRRLVVDDELRSCHLKVS